MGGGGQQRMMALAGAKWSIISLWPFSSAEAHLLAVTRQGAGLQHSIAQVPSK